MAAFARRFIVVAAIAFSHVSSISTRGIRIGRTTSASRYPKVISHRKSYSTSRVRYLSLRNSRPDDYIEAEIVSQTNNDPERKKNDNNQKVEILGIDKRGKEIKKEETGGIFNMIANFFGQDEETRQRKERKKKLNTAIDKIFEGSGALGTVFGSLAKGVGGIIAESLHTANADLEIIQSSVLSKLEADSDCVNALGGQIILSQPFTSSSSSSNINGVIKKEYFYIMSASGNSGEAQVQVRASMDGSKKVNVAELVLRTSSGRVINVGTGRGGGGGGGSGRVIDVEANVN